MLQTTMADPSADASPAPSGPPAGDGTGPSGISSEEFNARSKVSYYDPVSLLAKAIDRDPLLQALTSMWPDRQHVGRIAFEQMYECGAVSGAINSLFRYILSSEMMFKPQTRDPTPRQIQFAEFLNHQLDRLGVTGDPRQGRIAILNWLCSGLFYGFTLAEHETAIAPWRGRPRVQTQRILPLPQSSLDVGFMPRQEYGDGIMSMWDVRYRAIKTSPDGTIEAFYQYFKDTRGNPFQIEWKGANKKRILHYAHDPVHGNPYGTSIMYPAFKAWVSLYTIEAMEEAFLDAGLPYLTFSYKTKDGLPAPKLHAQVIEILKKQDPALRAFIMPNTDFGSVAPSNPNFTDHVFRRKAELRQYIRDSILGQAPSQSDAQASQQSNIRELLQVFFQSVMPAILGEFSNVLTWQFGKGLIDANWSNVSTEDYPVLEFTHIGDNQLRVAIPLLQMALNYIDSGRLGEFFQSLIPGFDSAWIPRDHKDSVSMQREPASSNTTRSGETGGKAPGTPDERTHGQHPDPAG